MSAGEVAKVLLERIGRLGPLCFAASIALGVVVFVDAPHLGALGPMKTEFAAWLGLAWLVSTVLLVGILLTATWEWIQDRRREAADREAEKAAEQARVAADEATEEERAKQQALRAKAAAEQQRATCRAKLNKNKWMWEVLAEILPQADGNLLYGRDDWTSQQTNTLIHLKRWEMLSIKYDGVMEFMPGWKDALHDVLAERATLRARRTLQRAREGKKDKDPTD